MVDTVETKIVAKATTIFETYKKECEVKGDCSILVAHFGVFNQDFIHSLAIRIENLMKTSAGDKKHVTKRMFSILIEGLQNIIIHGGSDSKGQQLGFLIIVKEKSNYKIFLGNIVEEKDKSEVIAYIGNINSHNDLELKNLYLRVLSDGYLSNKGGAGLGFITIRLKSGKDLDYNLYPMGGEKSFFVVQAELSRI